MVHVADGATTKFAMVRGVYTGDTSGFMPRFDSVMRHQDSSGMAPETGKAALSRTSPEATP